MDAAILGVSAVAALAALAAVVIPLWQQRPKLRLRLTGGWSTGTDYIEFSIAVENAGTRPIFQIGLDAPRDGETIRPGGFNNIGVLQPGESREFPVRRRVPEEVEVPAGALGPVLKQSLAFFATYGHHRMQLIHDAGAFNSGRAIVKRDRRR